METSDMHLFFFLFNMRRWFYKHSTNNAQTSNKYVGRKGMDLNYHGLLWAEMAMGQFDQRLLFAAKIYDSQYFCFIVYAHANRRSTPIPTEALCVFSHVLFVFVLVVPCFLSTATLYYIESQKPC